MSHESYDVPAGGQVHQCPYCARPFPDERRLRLHCGLDHPEQIDAEELAAFESAYEEEREELKRDRLVAVGVLVLLYFGLLIVYARL